MQLDYWDVRLSNFGQEFGNSFAKLLDIMNTAVVSLYICIITSMILEFPLPAIKCISLKQRERKVD